MTNETRFINHKRITIYNDTPKRRVKYKISRQPQSKDDDYPPIITTTTTLI
jgi:hypothetical protein